MITLNSANITETKNNTSILLTPLAAIVKLTNAVGVELQLLKAGITHPDRVRRPHQNFLGFLSIFRHNYTNRLLALGVQIVAKHLLFHTVSFLPVGRSVRSSLPI